MGVDYAELMAKETADRERMGSDEYDKFHLDFYAFEQMGQNIYDHPCCQPEHEIKDFESMWPGRTIFAAGLAMLVESVEGKSAHMRSAGGTIATASYEDRYGKWVAICFGDASALARADFA